jgi:uncharacterized membrane protein YbaN (DUF454 family)
MKRLFTVIGTLSLCLGILGVFVPLLPTTPLLLLAAACYARGSDRLHGWLINHRWFGAYIRDYRAGNGIPLRAKVTAIPLIWATIGMTASYAVSQVWLRILLVTIAAGITVYLLSIPTLKKAPKEG